MIMELPGALRRRTEGGRPEDGAPTRGWRRTDTWPTAPAIRSREVERW